MKVRYRQSGGVTGVSKGVDLDTAALPPEEARRLEPLSRHLTRGATPPPPVGSADMEQFTIIVDNDGQEHQLTLSRATVPPELKDAIQLLQSKAGYLKR